VPEEEAPLEALKTPQNSPEENECKGLPEGFKEAFIGNSGKFYVKNPFHNGKYCYAEYNSMEAYRNMEHLPIYTDRQKALMEFKEEVTLPKV
jgi:hypothetical protein